MKVTAWNENNCIDIYSEEVTTVILLNFFAGLYQMEGRMRFWLSLLVATASGAAPDDPCLVLLRNRIGLQTAFSSRISFCNSSLFCENLFWADSLDKTRVVYFEDDPPLDPVTCDEAKDSLSATATPAVLTTTTPEPSAVAPVILSERLVSELDVYESIASGPAVRRSFSELMDVLRTSIIPGILRFPFSESAEERTTFEEGLIRADTLISGLAHRSPSFPRDVRRTFALEIVSSRTFNKWRRSIGFLTANVINSYSQIVHVGSSRDLAGVSISQFLTFTRAFPLVTATFIPAAKVRELTNVLDLLFDEVDASDCDSDASSEAGAVTTIQPSASGRRPSFRVTPRSLADYPHKSRKCLVCAAIRASSDTLVRYPVFFEHLSRAINSTISSAAAASPDGAGFGGSHVCKNLVSHIHDAVCLMGDLFARADNRSISSDVEAGREFCRTSGEKTLKLIQFCNTRFRKDIPRLETIPMAIRLGRFCGTSLSYDTRANVLPSLMVNSLTPLEEERWTDDEEEDDEDEITSPSTSELHVPQGPNMAFVSLMRMSAMDRFSFESDLEVRFHGSLSVGDGTRKEWISAMFENMLLPSFQLFEYSDEREIFMKPRPLRTPSDMPDGSPQDVPYTEGMIKVVMRTYRQFGRLIGMALQDSICPGVSLTDGALAFIQRYPSKVNLTPIAISGMLKSEASLSHHSLENLKQTNWSNPAQASVVGEMDFEGLKPDGGSLRLTAANLNEFVELSMKRAVLDSIETQMTSVVMGIYEVLPIGRLSFLTIDELRLLLQGQPEIDRANLRASTEYSPAEVGSSEQIEWFWTIVESMSETQMRDFLRFVSGSSNPPIHNFSGYTGARKWLQVSVQSGLVSDQVPLSQTCFVQIRLPEYTSLDVMRTRLLFAIENARSMETP